MAEAGEKPENEKAEKATPRKRHQRRRARTEPLGPAAFKRSRQQASGGRVPVRSEADVAAEKLVGLVTRRKPERARAAMCAVQGVRTYSPKRADLS